MNFLLHAHFARRERPDETDDDAFTLGAMLPDLLRMVAPRRLVLRGDAVPTLATSGAKDVRDLAAGVAHHLDIDRWFHGAAPFVDGERALKDGFLATGSRRLVLFAHPAFEMCLDGAWLRVHEALDGADRLGSIAAGRTVRAALEAIDVGVDERRLDRVLGALADGMLYDDYRTASGVARRLAGIRAAFGLGAPTEIELDGWRRALDASVERSDGALGALEIERAGSFLREARP